MKRQRSAIIGCGAIGREHLAALVRSNCADIVSVCDLSRARAEATAERFGVSKYYSEYEEMISENQLDVVHVTTPPASHFALSTRCLASGLNVICEKPIALNYAEFASVRDDAISRGKMLVENQNYRFHSAVKRISNLINTGELGEVVDVQIEIFVDLASKDSSYVDQNVPHFSMALSTGVVGDFLPHVAYLVRMFAGPTLAVRAEGAKRIPSSPFPIDEYRAHIRTEGPTAYVSFSGRVQPPGFWIKVIGTKIMAEANLFESPRIVLRKMRSGERAMMTMIDGICEARDVFRSAINGVSRKLGGRTGYDGLQEFITRAYDHLISDAKPPVSLKEVDACALLVDQLSKVESSI